MTIDSDTTQFNRVLRDALLWPAGTILVTALLLLLLVFELFQMVGWSDHSYRVLADARKCENLFLGTQSDVRGYLLTGDKTFVEDFNAQSAEAETDLDILKGLVSDNKEQTQRIEDIDTARKLWLEHANTMLSHRAQNIAINPDWVNMGQSLMDEFQSRFDKLLKAEVDLRDSRLRKVDRLKTLLVYSGVAMAILLCVTIAHVVRKQMNALALSYRTALETIEHRHAALARSENDLEAQKEWLRVTLTSIGDGVIVTDPTGRVVLMNHESERMTGWTQSEALHQPLVSVFKIVNEETRATVVDPVGVVLKEKKVMGLANHTVLLSRTGEEWPIEDSAAPICDPKGTILGVVLVFHNATDSRLAQKSLRSYSVELEKQVADRTTTLQQMVSELEAFSYSVSHDLRSPLRAMQGFSEAVLEDYGEKLGDQGKDYLERIKNAAGRLDRLIQDLLSYTRISRLDAPPEVVDLNQLVHDIVEHDANLNPPSATVIVDKNLPKVMGRGTALNQVLTNLIGNAAKFVAPEKAPEIHIRAEDRGAMVRLWIEDNGIGIAPGDHERIFDMFTQVNDPSRYGGTGVGLAIVKKATQTMRGTCGVESTPGAGSRFWVELNKAGS